MSDREQVDMTMEDPAETVAIVGMSCRLPGAQDLGSFRAMLYEGRCARVSLGAEALEAAGVPRILSGRSDYVPACYPVEQFDCFDADFFGYSPAAAALLDPQHRLFLECAWHALEDSGNRPDSHGGNIGVFGGSNISTYLLFNLLKEVDPRRASRAIELLLANDKDYLASRVSYKLDLKGPSVVIQSACSSSLVAVCQAAQSLLSFECDMAIAGGAAIRTPHRVGYVHEPGGVLSPDGICRSFDAGAQGTVFGNGVGAVALKRLSDAVAEGDEIYAVIAGYAVNNDGNVKAGFAAPALQAQEEVVRTALQMAGLEPSAIGMIEGHGTGTAIGDPIEVAALARAFGQDHPGRCWLGSVKSNVGHLDSAAGVTGLMKAALAVSEGIVPPSLHFERPNPKIDFESTPFRVAVEPTPWPDLGGPRRAGVSSFGMGGTNAHVILEEAPRRKAGKEDDGSWRLLTVSARTEEALSRLCDDYAGRIEGGAKLREAAATAHLGRKLFDRRKVIVARTGAGTAAALRGQNVADGTAVRGTAASGKQPLAFLFSGQGLVSEGMGRELFEQEPAFRAGIHACQAALGDRAGAGFLLDFFGGTNSSTYFGWTDWRAPLLAFALQHGLARLWSSWGISPDFVLGHSVGEYAAAVEAGVMDLATAADWLLDRSRLMRDHATPGGMLSVSATPEELRGHLGDAMDELDVSGLNGPRSVVLSGSTQALEAAARDLEAAGFHPQPLEIPFACHSRHVEPMLEPFRSVLEGSRLAQPRFRMFSTSRGGETDALATADYWVSQVREPVRLESALEALIGAGAGVFVELGPAPAVAVHGKGSAAGKDLTWVSSLRPAASERRQMIEAFGRLVLTGNADPRRFEEVDRSRRIRLPLYPFERQRHWQEPPESSDSAPRTDDRVWAEVVDAAFAQAARPPEGLRLLDLPGVQAAAELFALAAMQRAMRELADVPAGGGEVSLRALLDAGAIDPRFGKLADTWARRLEAAGRARTEGGDRLIESGGECDYEDAKRALKNLVVDDDPYVAYMIGCGDPLASILSGRASPLETLFPRGKFGIVDALYRTAAPARYFNAIARSAVAALVARDGSAPFRVLEIGAGTGGMTSAILPPLREVGVDYVYTDVSGFFFGRASREFGSDGISYRVFDVMTGPEASGISSGGFDMVVASNVLHATTDVEAAARTATALLRPGGWLLLNEVTRNDPWLEMTTALIEGWQLYEDGWRSEGPLIPAEAWHALLDRCGMERSESIPHRNDPASILGQHVILARKKTEGGVWSRSVAREAAGDAPGQAPRHSIDVDSMLAALPPQDRVAAMEDYLRMVLADALGNADSSFIDPGQGFFDMGLDSLKAIDLAGRVTEEVGVELESSILFDYPTVGSLAPLLLDRWSAMRGIGDEDGASSDDDEDLVARLRKRLDADS